MPIYEYQCADCDRRIERLQKIDDPAPGPCEACGGSMQRQVSAPAFQFKGTGWYVTDYADRKGPDAEDGAKDNAKDTAASTDGGRDVSPESSNSKSDKSKPESGAGAAKATADAPAGKTAKATD